jgi:hypothetical protein
VPAAPPPPPQDHHHQQQQQQQQEELLADGSRPSSTLGQCETPGAPYDSTLAGPPLPGCEAERMATMKALALLVRRGFCVYVAGVLHGREVVASACRRSARVLPSRFEKKKHPCPPETKTKNQTKQDPPPEPELKSILALLSSIFSMRMSLIALFGDRRIWIMQAENLQVRSAAVWPAARRWMFGGLW